MIGSGNRFAHSAALAVAESPGESYNPLFLYGAPGLGKTHLLVSIANYLNRQRPDLPVVYTTAERFTSEFVKAVRSGGSGTPQAFKERYREVGALLIDDVQFLEGKPPTEDEFFHTFNELYSAGSQIVLSSDRPPEAMERLSERMRDRFAWGLTVELQGPDLATRIALLRRLATEHAIPTPDLDVLRQIAIATPENLRRLEGALTRVTAFASLVGEAPTADLVRRVLGQNPTGAAPAGRPTPAPGAAEELQEIQRAVCDVLHLSLADMTSPRRTPAAVRGRQLAMYVARNQTDLSLAEISRGFNRAAGSPLATNTPPVRSISQEPGVAETCTVCGRIASHSSNRSGRLSRQDGRRKPYSASVALRRKSPLYMPPICGTVTWLSSVKTSALSGRYSNRVGGGSPGRRPVR